MAFQNKNLSVIAYANGWTLWHYNASNETVETIRADDYFEVLNKLGYTGDIIIVCGATDTYFLRVNITPDKVVHTAPVGL